MKLMRRLPHRNIFTCMLSILSIACQHVPATGTQTQSFADRWQLTPQQRSELITKTSALDVQYQSKILEHYRNEEAASRSLLAHAAQRAQSGLGRRSELLGIQTQLSKDKIRRLQSSEQLLIAERAFKTHTNSAASVEEVLSGRVETIIPIASEKEAFTALGNSPYQNSIPGIQELFSVLWSRYETSRAINKQCQILIPISSQIENHSNKSMLVGLLSLYEYARVTREGSQQQIECLLYRHELDNIEVKLSVLLNAGTASSERP